MNDERFSTHEAKDDMLEAAPRFRLGVVQRSLNSLPFNLRRLLWGERKSRAEVRAAYVILNDGILAAKVVDSPEMVDADLWAATLDVIQNFMRTTMPILRNKSLSEIVHGDLRVLIERGNYAYLALLVKGPEEQGLRRRMRDILSTWEKTNEAILRAEESPQARQPSAAARGRVDDLLGLFLRRGRLYEGGDFELVTPGAD